MIARYDMIEKLKTMLTPRRLEHCLSVEAESIRLAGIHGADVIACGYAGLLHDCARDFSKERLLEEASTHPDKVPQDCKRVPILLHPYVGALVAEEIFEVSDERILRAIRCHTLGDTDMTLEDKVVCLADYIEPKRDFNGVETLRNLALKDINLALLTAFELTIKHLLLVSRCINIRLVESRNSILEKVGTQRAKRESFNIKI